MFKLTKGKIVNIFQGHPKYKKIQIYYPNKKSDVTLNTFFYIYTKRFNLINKYKYKCR
jgi:hypothetical protein